MHGQLGRQLHKSCCATSEQCSRLRRPVHHKRQKAVYQRIVARSTGRPGQGRSGGSGLILPNRDGRNGSAGNSTHTRLIIPGQDRQGEATSAAPPALTTRYRPPPGFMDQSSTDLRTLDPSLGPLNPQEAQQMMERIREMAGTWHQLAALFPRLTAGGYDMTVIEMECGIERATQNLWTVSQQVYDTLQKSGELPPEKLQYFDQEEGAAMLYHMRFLPVTARAATAAYIVDNQLDAREASILARAVKEQERREGEKEGFSAHPADCLAYKFYRDAIECRNGEQRQHLIKKGLACAFTEKAKAQLGVLNKEPETLEEKAQRAHLEVVRMTGEEVETRPFVLVGSLSEASPSDIAAAAHVRQSGAWNSFNMPAEAVGQQFVALPTYRSLLISRRPVGLSIPDCSVVPVILAAANVQTDADRKRYWGPGMVVLDRVVDEPIDPLAYYVVPEGGGVELKEGSQIASDVQVCGKVLFLARPPNRVVQPTADSYALVQL